MVIQSSMIREKIQLRSVTEAGSLTSALSIFEWQKYPAVSTNCQKINVVI